MLCLGDDETASAEALPQLRKEGKERKREKERHPTECRVPEKSTEREESLPRGSVQREREENNRMGKTRDLFKKTRDTKGTFHAKIGTIKDRNGMDLTEAEDIKKRWQEYTEEPYKKDLHDPDNRNGAIIHLDPDILQCEVK